MKDPNKIEIMKPDAIIKIDFKPDFYRRLVFLLETLIQDKNQEELQEAAKQIQENDIKDPWVVNYHTVAYLIKACEDYVQVNGLTEFTDISEISKQPL